VILTTTTAVALRSFRYPKIRGSELVPCAVVNQVGWFEMQVFRIPVFFENLFGVAEIPFYRFLS
jgi:hypothetical protein